MSGAIGKPTERNQQMKKKALLGLALGIFWAAACAAQPPQTSIQNKQLRVKVYLPDAKNGFYTGTRFDMSGVIGDLEFAGHHLYRPWFVSVDPTVRDFAYTDAGITAATNSAMVGPVEEFQTPQGYDTAKPGETFLKVGVGLLRKADDTPYAFAKHFELVDGGKWTTHSTKDSITFVQILGGKDSDYAYVYMKTVRLVPGSTELVIEHHLRNTGKLPIASKLYDHNFFTADGMDVGAGESVSVPYAVHPTRQPDPKFVSLTGTPTGTTAQYVVDLQGQDRVAFGLQGFSSDPKDYDFFITDPKAGVGVRIKGDRPLVDASVWSIRSVLAVEPFIAIQADPGKEFSWSYTYDYTVLSPRP